MMQNRERAVAAHLFLSRWGCGIHKYGKNWPWSGARTTHPFFMRVKTEWMGTDAGRPGDLVVVACRHLLLTISLYLMK